MYRQHEKGKEKFYLIRYKKKNRNVKFIWAEQRKREKERERDARKEYNCFFEMKKKKRTSKIEKK